MYNRAGMSANRAKLGLDRSGQPDQYRDTSSQLLQEDADRGINQLADTVSMIKRGVEGISIEIRKGDPLLDDIDEGMVSASDLLKQNMEKITTLISEGSTKHICYLAMFVVFVFLFLYYLMK
eukprot:TRINITY_DN2961_c0_g1_i1.p1 TRINITY_DN2961_c0_g1~~TRINITY_DN2961_c0_g1_i1.p1  ORF type:complete len:122 (+),score=18.28 TRINITY_DN2961_c0_g1_i1:47-412(+)